MKAPVPTPAAQEAAITALAVRRIATAIRHCTDEAALAAHVRDVLRLIPLLQHTTIDLGRPAGAAAAFNESTYAIPLRGSTGLRGVLRHPLGGEPLDEQGMGTLHAVADLLGAIADVAARAREGRRLTALLQFLVDQMPVGVVCLGARPTVLACNRAAAFFFEADVTGKPEALWALLDAVGAGGGPARCLRRGDRIGVLDVRFAMGQDPASGGGVVLIADCTEAVRVFRDALARETYRCLCETLPLTLAVVRRAGGLESLVLSAGAIGAQLPPGGACGMIDEGTFGIVLPGVDKPTAVSILRVLDLFRAVDDLQVGFGTLPGRLRSPEELIEAARAGVEAWDNSARPHVFVYDQASVVTETLAFVLRSECRITCANRNEVARQLLAERPYDGLILELAGAADGPSTEFARQAIALQPRARPFFLTGIPRPWPLLDWGLPDAAVFRKPFAVQEVRAAVRAAFAPRSDGPGG